MKIIIFQIFLVGLIINNNVLAGPVADAGLEAYDASHYPLARVMLEEALRTETQTASTKNVARWRETLAKVYWETGEDSKLLKFIDKKMSNKERKVWECRVLERRGHGDSTIKCWKNTNKYRNAARSLRTTLFLKTLIGKDAKFGYRPPLDE